MIPLLFILWLLRGVSCVEADGTKTASVKNRDLSLKLPRIGRHFSSCFPSDTKCIIKCSVSDVQKANLTWFKEDQICSQVNVMDRNPNPSLYLEVDYQDKSNYRCVLNSNQTVHANISQLCQQCQEKMTAMPVKKGDSVTLHANLGPIPKDTYFVWMFGHDEIVFGEIENNNTKLNDCDGRFTRITDRLKLDSQTGDLTITNTSKTDSEIFELQIHGDFFDCRFFNVTVSDPLPIPQISGHSSHCPSSGSECGVECSVLNVSHGTLTWYKGNSSLSNIIDVNYLCLKLDAKDNGNYSCVVSNSLINETKYLMISEVCSDQSNQILNICLGLGFVFVLVLFICYCYCAKTKCKQRANVTISYSQNIDRANPNQPLLDHSLSSAPVTDGAGSHSSSHQRDHSPK